MKNLPALHFTYEEATDRVDSLDYDDAHAYIGRGVEITWIDVDTGLRRTINGATVLSINDDETMTIGALFDSYTFPVWHTMEIRTIA